MKNLKVRRFPLHNVANSFGCFIHINVINFILPSGKITRFSDRAIFLHRRSQYKIEGGNI